MDQIEFDTCSKELWFEDASENNFKAAQLLEKLCKNFKNPQKIATQIHKLEHDGDQITHQIYNEVNRIFVTPLDREDIRITPIAKEFSEIIVSSTKVVAQTLPKLRNRKRNDSSLDFYHPCHSLYSFYKLYHTH